MVDGIPFLRVKRDHLRREALDRLDAGDDRGALVALLRDADDWWDGAPPDHADLHELVRNSAHVGLCDAMSALAYGRVGDYFAHRWTDPTFLAGLALIEAHWPNPSTGFELACGIGHYLRALQGQGVAVTGADVVFSKLWIARHFVLGPSARLICFDASAPWPIAGTAFDLVLCQDAFYFLETKVAMSARLRAAVGARGTLLVGHIHNREADNPSAGSALTADELAALFPDAIAYDDAELTRAAAEGRAPLSQPLKALRNVQAFALAEGRGRTSTVEFIPAGSTALRRNPLYHPTPDGWRIVWPSERYQAEYGPLATYPLHDRTTAPNADALRRRIFVDLPERW